MSASKKASFLLVLLMTVAAVWLRMGTVILAGLFSFMILDLTHRLFVRRLRPGLSRWLALAVFLFAAASITWMLGRFVHQIISTLPQIAAKAIPKLIVLSESHGIELPFDNAYELREIVVREIKDNLEMVTKASGLLTAGFFHVLLAVFAAILAFFCPPDENYEPSSYGAIRRELTARVRLFLLSFEKVFGAQIVISMVNTTLTATFLLLLGFPHIPFLVLATFLLGTLPVVGNILSNTIIVGTALTISSHHAAFALAFLILIHKGEYVLNSRIVGSSINARMWQTLAAILLGELVLGIPGIILAPALLHYVKEELQRIPEAQNSGHSAATVS
ncbi:MAG: AI-2E family transporter [Elusimicrobia bacterium]|nr:AI-2E family transporter [Elusimicrobiota bacterium]